MTGEWLSFEAAVSRLAVTEERRSSAMDMIDVRLRAGSVQARAAAVTGFDETPVSLGVDGSVPSELWCSLPAWAKIRWNSVSGDVVVTQANHWMAGGERTVGRLFSVTLCAADLGLVLASPDGPPTPTGTEEARRPAKPGRGRRPPAWFPVLEKIYLKAWERYCAAHSKGHLSATFPTDEALLEALLKEYTTEPVPKIASVTKYRQQLAAHHP